ncbi:hypothetical protein THAOC_03824 [Thalassiosira oceanica]|uniref:Uncharacterized protein n=1 Tax=Thalassiosira oceanica TaxID=159749 RepID=K0T6Q9_THAOC|nr:hypothetical protein THAOC_03824 [Thalassiosira oceanica]|eukprot:EJK74493.1 hypothetical protein THAOC_03824 [Thalassiosira oceanica]
MQDDMEGIRLRRRETYGPDPQIPAVGADVVFGSFVRSRFGELSFSPVIIAIGAGSGLGTSCLLYHIVAKRAFNGIRMPKESIYADARRMASFLGFRRLVQMSSDLPYVLASWRSPSRKSNGLGSNLHALSR